MLKKLLKSTMVMIMILTLTGMITGCNTMQGVGKDIEDAGESIEDAAE